MLKIWHFSKEKAQMDQLLGKLKYLFKEIKCYSTNVIKAKLLLKCHFNIYYSDRKSKSGNGISLK